MLFAGAGERVPAAELIEHVEKKRYAAKENDEFLKPIVVDEDGVIRDGDTLLFFDYRSDRMREIGSLLAEPAEPLPFTSAAKVDRSSLHVSIMTQYDERWKVPIVFAPQTNVNCLSEWLSKKGLAQFHTAETEKVHCAATQHSTWRRLRHRPRGAHTVCSVRCCLLVVSVCSRHILLQWRSRGAVRFRGPRTDSVSQSGHIRPGAGNESGGGGGQRGGGG